MITPLTLLGAETAVNLVGNTLGALFSDRQNQGTSTREADTKEFENLFETIRKNAQSTNALGITRENAIDLLGATVQIQNADGTLSEGTVEQIELQGSEPVFQINGEKYSPDQIVKILSTNINQGKAV